MNRRVFLGTLAGGLLTAPLATEAQQTRIYRVGVILQGGPYLGAVDGLRKGLAELELGEGKQVVLHVRDCKGDLKAVEQAARDLEREKVDLIYSLGTSVTLVVKRATKTVPIVFNAGSDPVAFGFVESFRKPGGRLTGIYSRFTDLTAKRLELLKEMLPRIRRGVTLRPRQSRRPAGREGRAGGSPPAEARTPREASRFCRGAAGSPARASGRGGRRLFLHAGRHGDQSVKLSRD